MDRRRYGAEGERAAEIFLRERGARVVGRNVRCPAGEIDLIAWMDGFLCFVEVKRRSSGAYGAPAEAVGPRKRDHIVRCAQWYLKANAMGEARVRFDVVEVVGDEVRHLPGAFRPKER